MRTPVATASTCCFCEYQLLTRAARSTWPSPPRPKPRPARRFYSRPSIAPKPQLDIKHIARNPGLYSQNCIDRNYRGLSDAPWKILELTQRRAKLQHDTRSHRQRNNALERQIQAARAVAKPNSSLHEDAPNASDTHMGNNLQDLLAAAKALKAEISEAADAEGRIQDTLHDLALSLPNLSSTHTPPGTAFDTVSTVASHPGALTRAGRSHVDIGLTLDVLDFAGAATTSGWGWYFLKNGAALLEQALVHFALSTLAVRGWTVVSPPSVVYAHVAAACGFQPRDANGEQQIYALAQADKDRAKPPLVLAATAEIPLASMMAARTLDEARLPLRCVAASRCYRAEAGARGVDTKGLYRVHEFTKVEMFAWTLPDTDATGVEGGGFTTNSDASAANDSGGHTTSVFEEMLAAQRQIVSALGLSYRELEMPAADLGASASRKRDIEVFFPSRFREADAAAGREADEGWGEVTSTSICTDYQARRLATRVRRRDGQLDWPHTVNGTALAVPRVLAAILETGWDEESQTVRIPKCLWPWMMGMQVIAKME